MASIDNSRIESRPSLNADIQTYYDSFPDELKLSIIAQLEYPMDTANFKAALPMLHGWLDEIERLALGDRSDEAKQADRYSCLFCARMLEKWKFADSQLMDDKARFGNYALRRHCIECGVTRLQRAQTVPFHANLFPSISQPSGYARGQPFYVRGHRFVVCETCGVMGKVSAQEADLQPVPRKSSCETCTDETAARSLQESLEEAWSLARDSQESPERLKEPRTERNMRRAYFRSLEERRRGIGDEPVRFPEMRYVGAMYRAQGY